MNKHLCEILLPKDIVFNRKFEDYSTWTEAFSNSISTVVFDYNKELEKDPENTCEIENDLVMRTTIDLPLIRCKDFTMVLTGQKVSRMEKFVGKILCKYDEDYDMIHVWFTTTDNDNHYIYLGCVKESELNEIGITVHKGWLDS